jgi:hypothetical protein
MHRISHGLSATPGVRVRLRWSFAKKSSFDRTTSFDKNNKVAAMARDGETAEA